MPRYQLYPNTLAGHAVVRLLQVAGFVTTRLNVRGFFRLAKIVGKYLPVDQRCLLQVEWDSSFCFFLADPYWARTISRVFQYEPEIRLALEAIKETDFVFLDCGANYGYWSVICSDPAIGCKSVIAVEAARDTFGHLEANRRLNGNRFSAMNKALFSSAGRIIYIHPGKWHGSNFVSGDQPSERSVETVTIDALAAEGLATGRPIVVKLDVEGAEIESLQGASETLRGDAVFIYEDHGKDQTSAVTGHMLSLGLTVIFLEEGCVYEILSPKHAGSFKKNAAKGYNFFAFTPDSSLRELFQRGHT